MVDNILGGNIYNASVHRIDVNFNVKGKNVDRMIGRAAHINLITQDSLFRMITQTIPELFQLKEDELDELNGARLFN